jgi:serine/threonine protein phosphatase PrpC
MARRCFEMAGITDAGSVRQFNEDSIAFDPDNGIIALADGMGGHRAGEVASRMTIKLIVEALQAEVEDLGTADGQHVPLQLVDHCVNGANDAVFDAAQAHPNYQGMGTTLVLGLFHDNRVTLAHIGDSRIYLLRGERLQLLTRDDSLLRDQVELGMIAAADASASHNRNLVTRALGMGRGVNAHLREDELMPGDLLLLCSDGLNDLVEDADIELILNALYANLPLAAYHLVQAAKDNGGHDNVSVVLAKVLRPFPSISHLPWYRRWLPWFR